MILKEIECFREFEIDDTTGEDEFNILMAYFLIVDETLVRQTKLAEEAALHDDALSIYRHLWTPLISQYEFNDFTNIAYEYFKLLSLLKYFSENYNSYLIEYLKAFKFKSISEFFGSFYNVAKTTFQDNDDKKFKRLVFITADTNVDTSHLSSQLINSKINTTPVSIKNLRELPLFYNKSNGFMLIDQDIYNKKAYRGAFFELFYKTSSLKKKKSNEKEYKFNEYSSDISYEVLEKICFRSVINTLLKSKKYYIHFDDGGDNIPDCYLRSNKTIYLFEFKGYVFPDKLVANPNFDDIKNYIDDRFIKTKCINQIKNQIENLKRNNYDFDNEFKAASSNKKVTIYQIVIHSDFYFTMPGINEYLDETFKSIIAKAARRKLSGVRTNAVG
jgi:hypothetical protein